MTSVEDGEVGSAVQSPAVKVEHFSVAEREARGKAARAEVPRKVHGKGAPELWVARVAPGRIMFEIDGVPESLAREAFLLAAAKLPIKTRFVQRIAE